MRDVDETYSVYDFVQEASAADFEDCQSWQTSDYRRGTGLYLQSLLEGYHLGGQVNQEKVLTYRKSLNFCQMTSF